jgi:cytoskeleton protein RodZ
MGSFGERMKREREMRGITLEEIANSTKIGTRSLKALEDEDFDQLPGGIFNKGFVRAYAKYLGIDEEQAVADFMAALEESLKPPTIVIEAQERAEREKKENEAAVRPWLALLAIVVVIAGGVVGYKYWEGQRGAEQAQTAPVVPPKPAPVAVTQPTTTTTTPGTTDATANPNTTATTTPGTPANPTSTTPTSTTTTNPTTPDTTATTTPAVAPVADTTKTPDTQKKTNEFTLDLRTRRASWMSVTVDGKVRFNGMLPEFQQRSFSAKSEIKLSLGNAGGVVVTFNGNELGVLGAEDKPRTVTFTAEGLRQ